MPATLYINGLQTCQLPAGAQISSKIKINNPWKRFPRGIHGKNQKQNNKQKNHKETQEGSAELPAVLMCVLVPSHPVTGGGL